jgi:hypothetical protein
MPRAIRTLLLGTGAGVLAWLIVRTGPSTIGRMLGSVGWGFAIVSALYLAHITVRALALWRSMAGPAVPFGDVLSVRLAGEAVEMLTFTGPFLAEPAQGFLLQRRGLSGARAYGAVAVEYVLYTLSSAWMAAAALAILLASNRLPQGMHGPVRAIIAGVAAFTIGCGWASATGRGLLAPIARAAARQLGGGRLQTLVSRLEPIEQVLVVFMHRRRPRVAEVMAIQMASQALLAAEIWVLLRALGYRPGAVAPLLVEGGVKFIGVAFFFVPGQVGASEGVYALLARLLGFPAAVGLTIALVRRVRALIVAAAGLGVITLTRSQSSARPARRSTR